MAEPLPEPAPPETLVDPAEADRALARKNMAWGWALFGLFWLLFGHGADRARLPLAGLIAARRRPPASAEPLS